MLKILVTSVALAVTWPVGHEWGPIEVGDTSPLTTEYTRRLVVPAGAAAPATTAPTAIVQGNLVALDFDGVGEQVGVSLRIPACYTDAASSDLTWSIYWASEAGDPVQDTETVIWQCAFRLLSWGDAGVNTDSGGLAFLATTYTQSGGAGADSSTHISSLTIDADGSPAVNAGDDIVGICQRDVASDTYTGGALVSRFELEVPCVGLPD